MESKINIVALLKQVDAIYHGGQPPFDLVYDQLIKDGHKIDYPTEKDKMWNLAKYNSKDNDGAVILYKSYLVKKYLYDILPTKGKLYIVDELDPNKKPIFL